MATQRRNPGRYVRFLQLITAAALAPLAVVVFSAMAPLGALVAAAGALIVAAAVVAPIETRIRFGFEDTLRPRWLSGLVVLFDLVWMATVFSPITTLLAGAVLLAMRRGSLGTACTVGVGLALAIAAYGVLIRRRWLRKPRVEIEIAGLSPELDGYRIAQLSDLHIGSIDRAREALSWARAANALGADLVVVTGDILTTGTAYHDDAVAVLATLRARDGVFACLGNHDYYAEGALCEKLAAHDVRVLRNEGAALANGKLFVAGVEDMWRGTPDLPAALRDRPDAAPVVLLAHNPEYFPVAKRAAIALTLSGHTHAGQLAVPFLVRKATLSHFVTKFVAGLYRDGDSQLFVHAGVGTTGPAIRLGAAPEIVEIVLRARASV